MSANEQLRDQQIQHAIHVLGYSNSLQNDMLGFLNDLEQDVVSKLGARLAVAQAKGRDPGPKTTQRMEETIDEIRSLTENVYSKAHDHLRDNLIPFAQAEAEQANKAVNAATRSKLSNKLPAPTLLKAIVTDRSHDGQILKPWVDKMGAATSDRVARQVRLGYANGEGVDKIVARVTGTEGFEGSKNSARAMVRTTVNSIANQAQQETWKANSHLIEGWQFVATLDSRTTLICSSLDGQIFPLGEGPIPPRHPQCRSTTIAVLKAANKVTAPMSAATRASMDGQVAAPTTMERFLKTKGEDFQNTIMGPTRADLWRRGKLNLNDFIRNYSEVIPLDDLRRLHPEAFGGAAAQAEAEAVEAIVAAPKPFSPINPAVMAQSVTVQPRKNVVASLTRALTSNKADSRYDPRHEFRGTKETDFGKAALSSAFTDEAASMIAAIMPEADAICDAFGVPRLRAIRSSTGRAIATMGDGTLTLNPTYFSGYATDVGGSSGASAAAKVVAERDALGAELKALREKNDAQKAKIQTLTGDDKNAAIMEYLDQADAFNAKRKKWMALDKKVLAARRTDAAAKTSASTWKVGDDPAARPFNATEYFETPMDRARNVIFHEVGHHVHQYRAKAGRRSVVGTPPVEKALRAMFQNKFFKLGEGFEAKKRISTKYGMENEHEWWAESFGLYMMGRHDLVDPDVKELIERLLKETQ